MEKIIKIRPEPKVFRFVRNGVGEEVKLERWKWLAYYSEHDFIEQFDEKTETFHQISEIDQSRLEYFAMHSSEDPRKLHILHFKPGMELIHYYRNTVLNAGTAQEVRYKIYCFGYAEKIADQVRKTVIMIHPDDTVRITNDDGKEQIKT